MVFPDGTVSSGASGRSVGGKAPYAGTWMKAVELSPCTVFVTVYGIVYASCASSNVMTVPCTLPCACRRAASSTCTDNSLNGPEGFAIRSAIFTVTLRLPSVVCAAILWS